ncbi:MAG: cytochrome P460 family protein [Pyrinomonadaceae bacterium]|nr:cytochrome P460 family protein [Pyrinomonadaceae bacterium]
MAGPTISIVDAEKITQPTPEENDNPDEAHPGSFTSFGVVYVNELARQAMLNEKKPAFPVGSIIVREKLETEASTTPQRLSVMIKRAKGFNKNEGDWEYIVADSSKDKTQALEKKINCLSCHGKQAESDYVFRSYLAEDVLSKQR